MNRNNVPVKKNIENKGVLRMKAFSGFITLDIRQQRFYEAAFSLHFSFFHSIISFGSHPSIRWEKTWIRKL